jgi:release factor glutamine methyltransferase
MQINQALQHISTILRSFNLPNHESEARLIVSHYTGIPHLELELHRTRHLSAEEWRVISICIDRRCRYEPLQYIFAEVTFIDLDFHIDRSVLIPRPETELLVERIIKDFGGMATPLRVLDIGTGSGVIAVTLKKLQPDWEVEATEISAEALQVAFQNARRHRTDITFYQSDIFPETGKIDKEQSLYNIIVSNPPYIPVDEYRELSREVREFEPREALLAEENGFYFYRRILEQAADFLLPEGSIYFEIGYNQAQTIKELARKLDYRVVDIYRDYQQIDRIIRLVI